MILLLPNVAKYFFYKKLTGRASLIGIDISHRINLKNIEIIEKWTESMSEHPKVNFELEGN